MRGWIISVVIMAFALFSAVLAAAVAETDTAEDPDLAGDTVVCLKNVSDHSALSVLHIESYMRRSSYSRSFGVPQNKTRCLRYYDAKEIVVHFFTPDDLKRRQRINMESGDCRRVKGGFTKFYLLGGDAEGNKTCTVDESKTDAQIREYVRGKKAFGK